MVRKCYWIIFIISHRVHPESRDDISHLWETKILSIELPLISFVDSFYLPFAFCENTRTSIVEVDLALDAVFIRDHRNALEDIFTRRILLPIYRIVSNISKCLISRMIHALIVLSIDMVPIDRPRAKYKIIEFWEEDEVSSIHTIAKICYRMSVAYYDRKCENLDYFLFLYFSMAFLDAKTGSISCHFFLFVSQRSHSWSEI